MLRVVCKGGKQTSGHVLGLRIAFWPKIRNLLLTVATSFSVCFSGRFSNKGYIFLILFLLISPN